MDDIAWIKIVSSHSLSKAVVISLKTRKAVFTVDGQEYPLVNGSSHYVCFKL